MWLQDLSSPIYALNLWKLKIFSYTLVYPSTLLFRHNQHHFIKHNMTFCPVLIETLARQTLKPSNSQGSNGLSSRKHLQAQDLRRSLIFIEGSCTSYKFKPNSTPLLSQLKNLTHIRHEEAMVVDDHPRVSSDQRDVVGDQLNGLTFPA